MTTTTTNYTWKMPDPGASANTWGDTLNATTQAIDAQVFVNQQGAVPIGAIVMFGGATAPANWLLCQGQSIDTTVYAKLFAVIGNTFGGVGSAGNFKLPNLGAQFPIGAGSNVQGRGTALGEVTGSFTIPIAAANLPAHTHPVTINDPKHIHTQTQTPHGHLDFGHSHTISEPPGGHVHGGVIQPGSQFSLGIAGGTLIGGAGNTTGATTGISIQAGAANIQPQVANLSAISTELTGITATAAANTGTGTLDVIPPFVCLNFIIKYN